MKDKEQAYKTAFESANKYHLLHSVALLFVPFTNRPNLTGALLSAGIVLFSGSCYLVAHKEDRTVGKLAPYGGMCLIAGWLSIIF
eukprot:JP440272.1.p1 GENE.JP440272.1~~JP440272.1.p1  ORF type:complete len:100 (+),score=9.71 JP440272.1:46-300(+)